MTEDALRLERILSLFGMPMYISVNESEPIANIYE